ncbi:MAG: D-glycerate dehydrogenase [Robiginitomaculum sp.]|nr:MAG: D-glycerate dehydrogenase [Robiginitomaculum sp.]
MANNKIKVGVTRKLPNATHERMLALFDVQMNPNDQALGRNQLLALAASCDVLCPTVTDDIDAEIFRAGKNNLKLVANFGAGTDHIDLKAANAAGIPVTNTPDVLTDDTADLTFALLLAVPRRIVEGAQLLRSGGYEAGWSPTWMMGRSLGNKKLGIVGMGRIGQAVAARARAFGLEVHYHNRKPVSPAIEESLHALYWSDLDEMLGEMDFVSLNCPLTKDTIHLMDRTRLGKLAGHAILINTARGKLIDEAALADALQAGQLAGAGLDVFEFEPKVEPRLLELPNVVALPHMGSSTLEARTAMGERMIINIKAFEDGHKPPDRVIRGLTT